MKNKKQFDNSIRVSVKAYFEGTLKHSDVCACEVGNLIADARGYKIAPNNDFPEFSAWYDAKNNILPALWYDSNETIDYSARSKEDIDSTGYTVAELTLIEKAFESVYDDQDGYKGLCAVFNVLVEIHQGSDEELEGAKGKLIKVSF